MVVLIVDVVELVGEKELEGVIEGSVVGEVVVEEAVVEDLCDVVV